MTQTIPNIPVDDTAWVDINTAAGIDVGKMMAITNKSNSWCRLYEGSVPPSVTSKDGEMITNLDKSSPRATILTDSLKIWALCAQEGRSIDLNVQELFFTSGGGSSGGGGFTLGPLQNVFTGVDRAAAELERDTYFAGAGAANLTTYNGDTTLNIRLEYDEVGNAIALFQVRNAAGDTWLDNSSATGVKGDAGESASIADDAYSAAWDGITAVAASKNAIYDKMETVTAAVALNTAKVSYPSVDSTKVGHISVTQAVNLDTIKSDTATNTSNLSDNTTDIANIRSTTGTVDGDVNMGVFTGGTISDNVSAKVGMQELETSLETKGTVDDTGYGASWNGVSAVAPSKNAVYDKIELVNTAVTLNTAKNTYPAGDATKVGYITVTQAVDLDTIESDVSGNASDISDIRTTTGTSDGETNLGVFSGTTISDNVSVKTGMQELETSLETKGTVDDGSYSVAWDNDTTVAPSKNAVYDKLEVLNSAITLNTAKNTYPLGDATKVGHISVTQTVNLDTIESDTAANTSDISDIRTTTGTSDGDTDMGTFTGNIISDNGSTKEGMQELESSLDGLVGIENKLPVVSIPFTHKVVDALSGYMTVERGTTTGNINFSGTRETLPIDELAITKDGASIYESYYNWLLHSGDITQPQWTKAGTSVGAAALGQELIEDGANAEHFLRQIVAPADTGFYGVSLKVKLGNGAARSVRIRLADSSGFLGAAYLNLTTATVYSTSVGVFAKTKELNDGWVEFSAYMATVTGINPQASVYMVEEGTTSTIYQGNSTSSVFVDELQLTTTEGRRPYMATTTIAEPRDAEEISIDVNGNMPAVGKPFTIMCDCTDIPRSNNANQFIFGSNATFWARQQVSSGLIQFSTGGGVASSSTDIDTTNGVRFAFVYTGTSAQVFANGELVASEGATAIYDIDDILAIGAYYTFIQKVNSEIKNFEIYHEALSADTIKAKGAA